MPDTSTGTRLRHWLQAPRYLLLLFFATTLGFLVGLAWLGWNAIEQGRIDAEAAAADDFAETTDTIAFEVRRALLEIENQIDRFSSVPDEQLLDSVGPWAERLTDDALVVVFEPGRVRAFPRGRLLYYPVLANAQQPYYTVGVSNRALTMAASDPDAAIEVLRLLAADPDIHVRAEALLSLADVQQQLGQTAAALSTLAEVTDPDAFAHGRPAEPYARARRCRLLLSTGRRAALAEDLERLSRDLHGGRWQLTRSVYEGLVAETLSLATAAGAASLTEPTAAARSVAAGVDWLWSEWSERDSAADTTNSLVSHVLEDQDVLTLARATRGRLVALVAGPKFLAERIIGPIRPLVDGRSARVVLDDRARPVLEYGSPVDGQETQVRVMAQTGLPWTLSVSAVVSPADTADLWGRQLIVVSLVFLAVFVVAGSYLSIRAVTREIEAARLKSDFVAAVSHEFRTPLTLLRQFSDLLADNRVSSEQERQRYYAALQRGTRRLTRLVEDLLDFGRMEAGSRGYTMQPVAAREWLFALTDEFHDDVCSKGFQIEVAWTGPPAVIDGDEAALGRALWNLLDNAVKYSPSSQTVWVTGHVEHGRLLVSVRDRGLGIPRRDRRAIFGKFVRGSAGAGPPIRGAGLGLALVQQIVEAHGGRVRLESVEGEGSTFTLDLPARAVEAAAQGEEPRQWRVS